ncbi:acyl carrier protein [Streptomyces parvus]|uniref:acyl carrier protein n=1 Tax=Streptomyces parvus TaxID=66428 RepID=UPI00081BC19A|nr:acyl carrier protein [Streptomyces sp. Termitarium-T10T-6]SCE13306.1 Acyl carrier protein [Streptomyces sp. Termitarium-T10T-6]
MNSRPTAPSDMSEQDVADRMVQLLADLLELAPEDIDPEVPLSAYGIDSVTSTWLAGELTSWCGIPLERELLLGRPSVVEAAEDVMEVVRRQPERNRV